jgi:hypothetical protein
MLRSSVYNSIKKGFNDGVYNSISLIKVNKEGQRETIIPHNKGKINGVARLDHIKHSIDRNLGAGSYVIECRTGPTSQSVHDRFNVEIKEPVLIPVKTDQGLQENIIDATNQQETMQNIELEDYLKLVRENADLKAQIKVLEMKDELYKELIQPFKNQGLNDGPQSISDRIFNSLSDQLPSIINIAEQFFNQRNKQIELKEKELNFKQGIKNKTTMPSNNPDQVVKRLEHLYYNDPIQFDNELDEMQNKDPELYSYVCEKLQLIEDEGGEEQE